MATAVERIWLKSYPEGIAHDVNIHEFASINDVLHQNCKQFATRPAYRQLGAEMSYGDVERLTRQFAAYLGSTLGLKKGTRIALMMPNILSYPIAIFGALRAGLVVVNTNPMYKERELEHQLNDAGAEAIVIWEGCAATLQGVIEKTKIKHVITTQVGDLMGFPKGWFINFMIRTVKKKVPPYNLPNAVKLNAALARGAASSFTEPAMTHDDLAFLQYTGGTTGVPKGAMLRHGNIVANLQQNSAWVSKGLVHGKEVIITALPLYHIYSLTCNCLTFMKVGGCNVLIADPRDIGNFIKIMRENQFTAISGVNTLYVALMNHPDFGTLNFKDVKLTSAGGMATQRAVAEKWMKLTGLPIVEGYGLTETSPVATSNPLSNKEFSGTIGLPIPSTVLTIRDDDCNVLPMGQAGEICISGPQVMSGYWQKPEETAKVMTPDGAFRTGDIGVMDERGYFKIVDRKKDMILVSGFNVYPNEIEDVIATHPGVLEACAVSAPDEKSGEVVRVVIVKKDPALTKEAVMEHCRAQLTGYKLPKIIEFWNELPKTNVGKILRKEVRDKKQ